MLFEFLLKYQTEILARTEKKSLVLAGVLSSSDKLKAGLPIFYNQLITVLKLELQAAPPQVDEPGMANAARDSNERAMATASGHPHEADLVEAAGHHGAELLELGYTLSHVVHAYGAMCQAITELAIIKDINISTTEFRDLNRCLDVAIAGAVTEYQSIQNIREVHREVEHLGFLVHELRNGLSAVNISLQLIKKGTVGFGGSTSQILDKNLKRLGEIIDRSLTEVRMRIDPKVYVESINLLKIIDQIILIATVEAASRNQTIDVQVQPSLVFETDQELLHSVISNLVQNALKYTPAGGKIKVRGDLLKERIVIEVEDQCGGLKTDIAENLFKPFMQKNENRKGLGLGLTIARRATHLIGGTIEVQNLPGTGCIFKISLPKITP